MVQPVKVVLGDQNVIETRLTAQRARGKAGKTCALCMHSTQHEAFIARGKGLLNAP